VGSLNKLFGGLAVISGVTALLCLVGYAVGSQTSGLNIVFGVSLVAIAIFALLASLADKKQ